MTRKIPFTKSDMLLPSLVAIASLVLVVDCALLDSSSGLTEDDIFATSGQSYEDSMSCPRYRYPIMIRPTHRNAYQVINGEDNPIRMRKRYNPLIRPWPQFGSSREDVVGGASGATAGHFGGSLPESQPSRPWDLVTILPNGDVCLVGKKLNMRLPSPSQGSSRLPFLLMLRRLVAKLCPPAIGCIISGPLN